MENYFNFAFKIVCFSVIAFYLVSPMNVYFPNIAHYAGQFGFTPTTTTIPLQRD
jgi:hypothetical protein